MKINLSRKVLAVGLAAILALGVITIYVVRYRAATGAFVNGARILIDPIDRRIEILREQDPGRFASSGGEAEERRLRRDLLEERVTLKAISQAAAKAGVKVSEGEIDARLEAQRKAYKSRAAFTKELEREGFSDYLIKDLLRDQLMAEKMRVKLAGETKVAKAEIDAYLSSNRSQFEGDKAQVKLKMLTVATPEDADKAIISLKQGTPLEIAANRYGVNKDTDLGWHPQDRLDADIRKAVMTLDAGRYSEAAVANPDNSLSIFMVEDRQVRKSTEAEIFNQASFKILRIKQKQSFGDWFRRTYKEADITFYK